MMINKKDINKYVPKWKSIFGEATANLGQYGSLMMGVYYINKEDIGGVITYGCAFTLMSLIRNAFRDLKEDKNFRTLEDSLKQK